MEGGATSPLGVFLLTTAFCCDLTSFFVPFFGPIISAIIMNTLLFLFKDQLKPQTPPEPEQPEEENKEPKEPSAPSDQKNKTAKENKKEEKTNKQQTKNDAPAKNQSSSKGTTLAPSKASSLMQQLRKGGLKGMIKDRIIHFLKQFIPFIGPFLASWIVLVWKLLK